MFPVYGREIHINHWIFFSIYDDRSLFPVNLIQEISPFKPKFRILFWALSFQFKLNHTDCLMHLHVQFFFFWMLLSRTFQGKTGTRVIFVCIQRKISQWKKIDSVAILQNIQIAITCADSDYICNTAFLSCCRPHPEYIMIPPLNIQWMIGQKLVHNQVRSRTSVINISDNMQVVHSQSLDQFAQCNNNVFRTSNFNNRIDNGSIIGLFIRHIRLAHNQFFHDVCIFLGKCFPNLRPSVLSGCILTNFNQPI